MFRKLALDVIFTWPHEIGSVPQSYKPGADDVAVVVPASAEDADAGPSGSVAAEPAGAVAAPRIGWGGGDGCDDEEGGIAAGVASWAAAKVRRVAPGGSTPHEYLPSAHRGITAGKVAAALDDDGAAAATVQGGSGPEGASAGGGAPKSARAAGAGAGAAGAAGACTSSGGSAPHSKVLRGPAKFRCVAVCTLGPRSRSRCGNSALSFRSSSLPVTRCGILSASGSGLYGPSRSLFSRATSAATSTSGSPRSAQGQKPERAFSIS